MGSGYFPVERDSEIGKKIIEAERILREAYSEGWDLALENDQYDNAAEDGAAMGRLSVSIAALDGIVEREGR